MKVQYKRYSLGVILATILLSGCGGSSSNSGGNGDDNGGGDGGGSASISAKFATQASTSDARYIDGASELKKDINSLFGDANATPIELKKGETLNVIFDRLGS
jgi:hypothetical protein